MLNHKGGTGKTTTCINLGKALADLDWRVLLVDFDNQANLSYSLGLNYIEETCEHLLESGGPLNEAIQAVENFYVLPSKGMDRFDAMPTLHSPYLLKEALQQVKNDFGVILIDCSPTVSSQVLNALLASDFVFIPFQVDVLSVEGIAQVMSSVDHVNEKYGHDLEILGAAPVMVDRRRMLSTEILNHVGENYNVRLFNSIVRNNVKVAEAPSFGKSVIEYDHKSNGAHDYRALAEEFTEIVLEHHQEI